MCFSLLWVFVPVLVLLSVVLLKPDGRQRQHCATLSPRKKKGYISVAGFSLSWLQRSSPWCDAGDAWALAGRINAGALSTRDVWLVKELPGTAEGGYAKCQLSPESQSSLHFSFLETLCWNSQQNKQTNPKTCVCNVLNTHTNQVISRLIF